MILDISDFTQGTVRECDLCIVGGGAAGITLALEFAHSPLKVILLESGGRQYEAATQDLYATEQPGLPHKGAMEGRARVFGGSTRWWAAQALPFAPFDFTERPWVADSGWPLTFTDLEPYYRRAEKVYPVPESTYDTRTWPSVLGSPPDYAPDQLLAFYSQYSLTPDFARAYSASLEQSKSVEVICHANVTSLDATAEGNALQSVQACSLNGHSLHVRARWFVVCAGAIETARLLLASRNVCQQGLGNDQDLVGRYFQDHLRCRVAPLTIQDPARFHKTFYPVTTNQARYRHKFSASPALQERERILAACGEVFYDPLSNAPLDAAKNLVRAFTHPEVHPYIPSLLREVTRHPDAVLRGIYRRLRGQGMADQGGTPYLSIDSEQAPNYHSRVRLSETCDALGMPKTILDWQLTSLERHTLLVFARTAVRELQRLGLACADLSDFTLPEQPDAMIGRVEDVFHHMGTTRMHTNPRQGVVDLHCRVHGISNLYIGSGAVFPTGSSSNCTLTILALCLRLADELKHLA